MLAFEYWKLSGLRLRKFLHSCTTSNWQEISAQPTALLNSAGRVIACAWIELSADEKTALWVLEKSTTKIVQQQLMLAVQFARLSWEKQQAQQRDKNPLIPWLQQRNSGLFTAHDLSLDLLGLLDLDKGCYTGQEIVARVHARVTHHKRRVFWIKTQFEPLQDSHLYSLHRNVLSVLPVAQISQDAAEPPEGSKQQVKRTDIGPLF